MNEYSSDTKKVAAKLAGMTDACANVHDDERLTELFALAPDWAVGIVTDEIGRRFWSTEIVEIKAPELASKRMQYIDQKGDKDHRGELWQEIPRSERELNRLADGYDFWPLLISENYQTDVYKAEWQARRQQRIAAGLINVNDTDVVDMQDSQQEWAGGLPTEGTKCEYRLYSHVQGEKHYGRWFPCVIEKVLSGRLLIRRFHGIMGEDADPECRDGYQFVYTESNRLLVEFRPIQPGQKPDEQQLVSELAREIKAGHGDLSKIALANDYQVIARTAIDYLVSTGRLTQGGGDE